MGRQLSILIIPIFLLCCNKNDKAIDKRIYIGFINHYSGHGEITELNDNNYFSKGFWDYFIKKFPNATATIFYSAVPTQLNLVNLKDTSLIVQPGDYDTFTRLYNSLPKNADGQEKINNQLLMGGFEIDSNDKAKKNKEKVQVPLMTQSIAKEYLRFLDLLKDTNKKPIFVYKKDFLVQIEQVYK